MCRVFFPDILAVSSVQSRKKISIFWTPYLQNINILLSNNFSDVNLTDSHQKTPYHKTRMLFTLHLLRSIPSTYLFQQPRICVHLQYCTFLCQSPHHKLVQQYLLNNIRVEHLHFE
jgi:hypothetical protein